MNTLQNQVRKRDKESTPKIYLLFIIDSSTGILGSYVLTVIVEVGEIKQNISVELFLFGS